MTVRKLGRGVAIVGAGMSRFGAFPGDSPAICSFEPFGDARLCRQGI